VSSTAPLKSRSLRVRGADVVLERPEVVHLLAVAEVDREQVALRTLAVEPGLGAQPGVVAAERGPPTTTRGHHGRDVHAAARSTTSPHRTPATLT